MENVMKKFLTCVLALSMTYTTVYAEDADIAGALDHPDRPSADKENDARRMPLEVLEFAGLRSRRGLLHRNH